MLGDNRLSFLDIKNIQLSSPKQETFGPFLLKTEIKHLLNVFSINSTILVFGTISLFLQSPKSI